MRLALSLTLCLSLAACSSESPVDPPVDAGNTPVDTGAPSDAGDTDSGTPLTDAGDTDAGSPTDAGNTPTCGSERPDISSIRGTEGLVIGPDGTIYYSQNRAVGRLRPGMAPEPTWASLPTGATTVWGLALDPSRNRLYVGVPTTRVIYVIDTTADAPSGMPYVSSAGQPNGLTLAADGTLYYSDFGGGHVYRVPVDGMRARVTTSVIQQANGLAFNTDGRLYVDSYGAGSLIALTLTDGAETARETIATNLGNPDGLAFDAMGRIYIGDNGRGRVIRLDADGSNPMTLRSGVSQAANVEFGAGALPCSDIYVASGGVLARIEGDTAGAAVPWHR